jgi:hypothetical protein
MKLIVKNRRPQRLVEDLKNELEEDALLLEQLIKEERATWGDLAKFFSKADPKTLTNRFKKFGKNALAAIGKAGLTAGAAALAPKILVGLGIGAAAPKIAQQLIKLLGDDASQWTKDKVQAAIEKVGHGIGTFITANAIMGAVDKITGNTVLDRLNISDPITKVVEKKYEEAFYTFMNGWFKQNPMGPNGNPDEVIPKRWADRMFNKWLQSKAGVTVSAGIAGDAEPKVTAEGKTLDEASYEGNLGAEEVMKFYLQASDEKVDAFEKFMADGDENSAWRMIQDATGVDLVGMPSAVGTEIQEMSLRMDTLDDPFAEELYGALVSREKEAIVYHGTSTAYFWDIVNNGFKFAEDRKNFDNTSPGTYFAFTQNRAGMYTIRSTEKAGGEGIIFVAELPLARLSKDLDDAASWDKTTKLQAMVADEIDPGDITGVVYPASSDGPEIPINRFIEWVNRGNIPGIAPEDEEQERTFKTATEDDIEHAVVDYIQDLIQYTSFTEHNYGLGMARFNEKLLAALHTMDYEKYKFWNADVWVTFIEKMLGEENEEDYYKQDRRFQLPLYRVIKKYIEEPKYFEKFRKAKGYNLNLADPSSAGTWDADSLSEGWKEKVLAATMASSIGAASPSMASEPTQDAPISQAQEEDSLEQLERDKTHREKVHVARWQAWDDHYNGHIDTDEWFEIEADPSKLNKDFSPYEWDQLPNIDHNNFEDQEEKEWEDLKKWYKKRRARIGDQGDEVSKGYPATERSPHRGIPKWARGL